MILTNVLQYQILPIDIHGELKINFINFNCKILTNGVIIFCSGSKGKFYDSSFDMYS